MKTTSLFPGGLNSQSLRYQTMVTADYKTSHYQTSLSKSFKTLSEQ